MRAMERERKKQEYLTKAKLAEQDAATAREADSCGSWLKIAASYRALAHRV